jgi:hypothetical protein
MRWDGLWHFGVSPYLWFAGLYGEAGAAGHLVGIHVSTIDLFSHFRIGPTGEMEARKNRFLLSNDLMWIRLGDDKSVPLNDTEIQSIDVGLHALSRRFHPIREASK